MVISPQSSLGLSTSSVCVCCYFKSFGFLRHAHRSPRAKRQGQKEVLHMEASARRRATDFPTVTSVLSLFFRFVQNNTQMLLLLLVGGRNNRDLVTLQIKYLRGIHFIQQAAQLQCTKR